MSRRDFLKLGAATLLGGVFGYTYIRRIEPAWLELNEIELQLPRLGPAFDGYRLLQFSDIHMGSWTSAGHLREVVSLANQLDPDLVAITGDFFTHAPWEHAPALIENLGSLQARDGVVAVLGNHDHWNDAGLVRSILRQSQVRELHNQAIFLQRGADTLSIAGVDDYMENQARLEPVLEQLPEDGAAILLAHEPDYADISAASGRFDLQISGHSHGGQVWLPFIGAPFLPAHSEKYPRGLYRVNGMYQYTNRGLGMVHLPFRFNSRPEITLFHLRSVT